MARTPLVWSISLGQHNQIVAAPTKKAAREALGLTVGEFNAHASVTGNQEDIALALSLPGATFHQLNDRAGRPWHEGQAYRCDGCRRAGRP